MSGRRSAPTLPSFSSVMGRWRFWLGWFFGRLLIRVDPLRVKDAWLVDALVGVRTEKVALCLQEIGRKSRLAITIEISERRAKRRNGYAMLDSC